MAAGLLLTAGGVAAAGPDSPGNSGGGKPGPAASGNGNGNGNGKGNGKPQGNSKADSPGNSGGSPGNSGGNAGGNSSGNSGSNSQGNKPANAGKSNGNSQGNSQGANSNGSNGSNGSSGTKTLPDAASPVAQAAVNKEKPNDTGAPEEVVTPDPTTAPVPEESVDTPAPARDTAAQSGAATVAGPETNSQPAPAVPLSGRDDKRPDAPATAAFTAPRSPAGGVGPVDSPAQEGVPARVGRWIGAAATTIAREVRDALREVTLKDLALAALPGIAGLLFFLATGVGLGHRQARFTFVIETAGASRLAPRGPLGLVGTVGAGSFIHVPTPVAARRATPARRLRVVHRAA